MNEAVEIEKRVPPARPALWEAYNRKLWGRSQARWGKYIFALTYRTFPGVYRASLGTTRYQCHLGATAVLLAAERHRRKTGGWPSSIAAIDRGILATELIDPYSGESFRMARRDGQILVYSVGPNRKDENGAYNEQYWQTKSNDDFGAALWDVSLRRQPPSTEDGASDEDEQ